MKAIIYCRVSTKEQAQHGYSLEAQENACRSFAEANSYVVDRVFVERGESAKTTDRTQLQAMLAHIGTHHQKISTVVVWKFDRLSRNLKNLLDLTEHLARSGIRILSVTENNEESSAGKLHRGMVALFGEFENDVKRDRVIHAMKQAVQSGRWCWQPPIGYGRKLDSTGKSILTPNDKAPLIAEAFRLCLAGLKQVEIAEELQRKGFRRMTPGLVNRTLRNPLYCSLIHVDWFPDYIDAIHKPIVSQEAFFKVQQILAGKKTEAAARRQNNPDFPLRGLVKCDECGSRLTAGYSRGRWGGRYPYYFCWRGCSVSISKQVLEQKFFNELEGLQPAPKIYRLFRVTIERKWHHLKRELTADSDRIHRQLKDAEDKKQRIDELMIKGVFDEEDYRAHTKEVKAEIMAKKIELSESKIDRVDISICLEYCQFFMTNIAKLWSNAAPELKQRVQSVVFPQGIFLDRNARLRTPAISLIFNTLRSMPASKIKLGVPKGI